MKETAESFLFTPTKAAGRLAQNDTDALVPAPFTSWTAEADL